MANKTITDIKPFIHPDVPGVDKLTLERAIRFTVDEFLEKTWLLQKSFTFTVDTEDIDDELYDSIVISTKSFFPYHRPFAIKELKVNGSDWDLKYIDIVNDTSYLDEIKEDGYKVFSIFNTYNIRLAPFSSADEIYLKCVYKPLTDWMYIDEVIYNEWLECIAAGTKSRLLDIPGKPWTNHPASNRWERIFRSKMSDAKRQVNKNFTGKSNSVYPREFGF